MAVRKDTIELLRSLLIDGVCQPPGYVYVEERPRAERLIKAGAAKLAEKTVEPVQEPAKDPVVEELEGKGTEGAENAAKILANLKNAKK